MKNFISILIALSVATSVICGAILLKQKQNAAAIANSENATENNSENSTEKNSVTNENAVNPNSKLSAEKFSWLNFQTDDLKEFVRRLRAVNCPEPTVQDLVLAEVNRRYGKKEQALWPDRWSQNDYWKPYQRKRDPVEAKKNRELSKQYRALQKEKTALLIDLLGVDIEKQHYAEEGIDTSSWNAFNNLSFLPEYKRDSVQKVLDDFSDKEQDFYASISGAWDSDARAKQKALEQEKFAALGQILTPDELRQYELRNSQIANQLMSELHGVSLTEQQYETLYDIRAKYGDSIYNYGDAGNDPATIKQIEQNKNNMQTEISAALGADTSQQLQRAQDYNYQQLSSMAAHYNLPADTAPKIYDFKQSAENAVKDLNANTDLTPDQKQAALQQIRDATQQSVKTALGDKIYKNYINNGGWWINQLAPTAKRPTQIIVPAQIISP